MITLTGRSKKILLTVIPPLLLAVAFCFRRQIIALSAYSPICVFNHSTGLLCPGCGNTRAARALLSLHPINALRYNISLPLILIWVALYYAECVISAWIKPVRLVPRKPLFYAVIGAIFLVYCIVRNFVDLMP